jgi:hypothetical protein
VEESPDRLGRWFARYGDDGTETFSARLLGGTDELAIAWASNLQQIVSNVAEIQAAIGRSIPKITGTASDGIEAIIKAGRFSGDLYAKSLSRHLGGKWRVEALRRPGIMNEVWVIIAIRFGA